LTLPASPRGEAVENSGKAPGQTPRLTLAVGPDCDLFLSGTIYASGEVRFLALPARP
jgi:hypothetical protein